MSLLYPTLRKNRITDIKADDLRLLEVDGVLLDVDNTLTRYKSQELTDDIKEWLSRMQEAGFSLIIVSNGFSKRVKPFAEKAGLRWIAFACKPSPFGYVSGAGRLGFPCRRCVIIGDQMFTDVVGANLCGMKSILLNPIEPEQGKPTLRFKRWCERKLLKHKYPNDTFLNENR